MTVRNQPAAFTCIEIDGAEAVEQGNQFGAGAPGAATGNHQHAACGPQEIDGFLDLSRVGTRDGAGLGVEMFFQLQCLRHDAAQRVVGNDVGRTGLTA